MPIAVLVTIIKKWKPLKCPSVDRCINKMSYIHTVECSLAIKRNWLLTWANKEGPCMKESRKPTEHLSLSLWQNNRQEAMRGWGSRFIWVYRTHNPSYSGKHGGRRLLLTLYSLSGSRAQVHPVYKTPRLAMVSSSSKTPTHKGSTIPQVVPPAGD